MRYLLDTIEDHIMWETRHDAKLLRFILPAYPSSLLWQLGCKLNERFNRQLDKRIELSYGVAFRLGQQWLDHGSEEDKNNLKCLINKKWYNQDNNLTSLRNKQLAGEDLLVIILAGYEYIDDRAGLQDFFHLDQVSIWDICLRQSFIPWISQALSAHFNPDMEHPAIKSINTLLSALYKQGIASLITISDYLEKLSFVGTSNEREAYTVILSNLADFKIPSLMGMLRKTDKNMNTYISHAQEFFNYGMFLVNKKRKSAQEKVKQYREAIDNDELKYYPEAEQLGQYENVVLLLDDLEQYLNEQSKDAQQRLVTADFVYIYDEILQLKNKPNNGNKNPKPKKLRGTPPEVFLRALWFTFTDLKKVIRPTVILPEQIQKITMHSVLFKHDFNSGGEDNENDRAQLFLQRVLGGIDEYFEGQLCLNIGTKNNPVMVEFSSSLVPDEDLGYEKAKTAEPYLLFEVIINRYAEKPLKKQFMWMLPNTHPSRLLISLYEQVYSQLRNQNELPAYATGYMPEIFSVTDEEAVIRLLDKALAGSHFELLDLLGAPGIEANDPLLSSLQELATIYHQFIKCVIKNGFFTAINQQFSALKQAYERACKKYLETSNDSNLGPLLFKAFMLVDKQIINGTSWAWNAYFESGIVTPLHPVLLEMMRQQFSFLCECFAVYVRDGLITVGENRLAEKYWDRAVDLARLQWPIYGIIEDSGMKLSTAMRSYNYLHLVGQTKRIPSFINSRSLLEYEGEEDEELSDEELFRSSRASQLIKQVLLDYQKLHPQAYDGISIGVYCTKELQPVIAGIDAFLADTFADQIENYSLHLTIFSDSDVDANIMSWINAWRDHWQQPEQNNNRQHYDRCQISIAYRVVSRANNAEQFKRLLKGTELDVMLFADFIETENSRFVEIGDGENIVDDYRKFPVLEKICCRMRGGGNEDRRERILTNRRFNLSTLHTEIVYRLQNQNIAAEKQHAIVNYCDFSPWRGIVDAAHEHSAWVVCIDPLIDEELIIRRPGANPGEKTRDIIGFGTGVGPHGENNYTVSTDKYSMVDVKLRMANQLRRLYPGLDGQVVKECADLLVQEASNLTGMSVVKATGPDRFVREYIAAAMVRKLLPRDNDTFCDEIIALDAFLHWFDDPREQRRPDLLRLRARIEAGYFVIDAQIIECKLAKVADNLLTDARQQLESGLRQLIRHFKPRQDNCPVGIGVIEDNNPEERYWWMQLHRLLSSKGEVTRGQYPQTLVALERLSDGYFTINWQGAAIAFWRDGEGDLWQCQPRWDFEFDGENMPLYVGEAANGFIPAYCTGQYGARVFYDNDNPISYTFTKELARKEVNNNVEIVVLPDLDKNYDTGNHNEKTPDVDNSNVEIARDEEKPISVMTAIQPTIPKRLLLGSMSNTSRQIYWEFGHGDLPNRHILVFGSSGSGKTYTIQALLSELGKSEQNSLIVDYTNGFTNKQLEEIVVDRLKPQQHIVRNEALTINPFRRQLYSIDDIEFLDKPINVAERVTGVFSEVYNLGDQQRSALYEAITDGVTQYEDKFTLDHLLDQLDYIREAGGANANSAASVITKVRPFVAMKPFKTEEIESWEKMFSDKQSRCHILQLAGFMKDTARLITEFSLLDLYWYYRAQGNKDKPRVIVLDEIQNLDHRLDGPLGQMLTEGRKFGISLILATQTLSSFNKEQRDRLFQASHKLFFKPADTEIKTYAQILSDATGEKAEEWVRRLTSLNRGECYSMGYALNERTGGLDVNKCVKIRIETLNSRF